jgi:hypothetical protein
MKNLKQVVREGLGRPVSCRVAARAAALTSVLGSAVARWALPAAALAVSRPQLPFRCFAQVGVAHGSTVVRCPR